MLKNIPIISHLFSQGLYSSALALYGLCMLHAHPSLLTFGGVPPLLTFGGVAQGGQGRAGGCEAAEAYVTFQPTSP